jgi:hypothetical protein
MAYLVYNYVMKRKILNSISTIVLIIVAFLLGLVYPNGSDIQEPIPTPQNIELQIIDSCTTDNYFTVNDYYFYCFPVQDSKYSASNFNILISQNS